MCSLLAQRAPQQTQMALDSRFSCLVHRQGRVGTALLTHQIQQQRRTFSSNLCNNCHFVGAFFKIVGLTLKGDLFSKLQPVYYYYYLFGAK